MLLLAPCPILLETGMVRMHLYIRDLESTTPKMSLDFKGHHKWTIRSLCCLCYQGVFLRGWYLRTGLYMTQSNQYWLLTPQCGEHSADAVETEIWKVPEDENSAFKGLGGRKMTLAIWGTILRWTVMLYSDRLPSSPLTHKQTLVQKDTCIFAVMCMRSNADPWVTFSLNSKCFLSLTDLFPNAPS